MKRSLVFCLIGSVILFSCQSKKEGEDDLSHKVFRYENSDWKSKKVSHFTENITYTATEVPNEYYLLKNLSKDQKDSLQTYSERYKTERIVEFEFEHINNDDLLSVEHTQLNYDESVSYMATTLRNDFVAVTSSFDTIPCSGVHFERHFKVSPFKRVLLYFGNVPENETIQLIYKDQLFNKGTFKFKLDEIPFKI